jgi:hypothetical protein
VIAQVIVVGSCCPVQRRGTRHDSDRGGKLVIRSGVVQAVVCCPTAASISSLPSNTGRAGASSICPSSVNAEFLRRAMK